MTNPEANEFFDTRVEEVVGGDQKHLDHRSAFEAKPSIAQAPKKSRGTFRLIQQFHFDIPTDIIKLNEEAHGRQYPDGVDLARAAVEWLTAEGKLPDAEILKKSAVTVTWEVAK